MDMIELHGVTKVYGEGSAQIRALDGVDLRVPAGEFLSIMGASGSGKSTLLNVMSALDSPTSGEVHIDGEEIGRLDDEALTTFRRRKIGLVFQFFNLLPTLDVVGNVLLPVQLERRDGKADHERARMLLEEVGLGLRGEHRVHQLSGGEMQRVAIARALMLRPRIVLADEPTGNLDSVTGAKILDLLCDTCARHETTVVMVTHDPAAAEVGHRIVSLRDGMIVSDQRTSRSKVSAVAQR